MARERLGFVGEAEDSNDNPASAVAKPNLSLRAITLL
jgi:hypothetical protein